jgi:predicted DCC family thiol-disulfide oxidoreductase YuxK
MDTPKQQPTEAAPRHGWILYDGDCALCSGLSVKFGRFLSRRGLALAPLQTPWVMQRLGLKPGEIPEEIKLLSATGEIFGGHHAFAQIARGIWWAWPVYLVFRLPGMDPVCRCGYRWLAIRRHLWSRMLHPPPPLWHSGLRYGVSTVWLFHGLYSKLLNGIPRHQLIVARILGQDHAWLATKAIGLGEIMMAVWMASGITPRRCAAVQTLLLLGMNALELTLARDLLFAPFWMVAANLLLVTAAWIVALRSGAPEAAAPACCPAGGG